MPAGGVHPRGNGGQSPGSGLPSSPWVELLPAWIDHDAWACLLKDKAPHSRGFLLHVTEAENAGGTVKCHPRQPEYDPSGASYPIPPAHSSKCQLFQIRCYLINANFFHGKTSDFTVQWLLGSWRSAAHLNSAGCLIYRQRVYRQLLLSPFSALGSLSHGGAGPGGRWPRRQLRAFCPLPSPCAVSEPRERLVSPWPWSRCSNSPTGPGRSDERHCTSRMGRPLCHAMCGDRTSPRGQDLPQHPWA